MPDKPFLKRMQLLGKIGNWTDMGAGHVRGYPGLVHTSLQISEYIPKCKTFSEPFAGMGRISKHVQADRKILNDKSNYAFVYLKKTFPNAIVERWDFETFTKFYDADVYFFDPPWSKTEYEKGCRDRAFCDRTPKDYYDIIFKLIEKLDGHWFVCGNKNNTRLKDTRYYHKLFKSNKKIMGGNISTLVMSNKPFRRYHQTTLGVERS